MSTLAALADLATVGVAIYARVSTDEQANGTSLDDQETGGRAWLAAQDPATHTLAGTYRDDCSGATDERPEWQRLLADVRAGRVQVIVVAKWDRWCRDVYVGQKMLRDVRAHGVRVVCLAGDMDTTTPEGGLFVGQMMGFAEYDRRNIVRRTATGRHGVAAAGFWPGGVPRYGYRREGSKRAYVLVPDHRDDGHGEADVLRRGWELVTQENATYAQAAVTLNAAGMTRRDGRAWDPDALAKSLTDRTITGRFLWAAGKNATGAWGAPKLLTYPGILTDAEHAALLAATARARKPAEQHDYLLTTRLHAPCGTTYTGMYRNDRANGRQYRCAGKKRHPDRARCTCPRLHADATEDRVWTAIAGFLADEDRMQRIVTDYLGLRAAQVTVERDELATVRRHIATLERAVATTLVDYARAGIDPTATAAATRTLQAELDDARTRETAILTWQTASADEAERLRTIADIAATARARLADMTHERRVQVLHLLDVRVTVHDNDHTTPALTVKGRLAWLDLHHTLAGNPDEAHL